MVFVRLRFSYHSVKIAFCQSGLSSAWAVLVPRILATAVSLFSDDGVRVIIWVGEIAGFLDGVGECVFVNTGVFSATVHDVRMMVVRRAMMAVVSLRKGMFDFRVV